MNLPYDSGDQRPASADSGYLTMGLGCQGFDDQMSDQNPVWLGIIGETHGYSSQ